MTQSRVLVTGGTGFIGRHLIPLLAGVGYQVRVLSRGQTPEQSYDAQVEYIAGDFTDPATIKEALDEVDVVYHLAATTKPADSNDRILFDAESNLLGSVRLMERAAREGTKRFVFTSSGGSVYGLTPHVPTHEDCPTNPISAHAVSKLAVEKYLEVIRREYGMEYRIARGGNPYGEDQLPSTGQGFVATAMHAMARSQPVHIWGDGSTVRDFFHVADLARALLLLAEDTGPHKIYNVGSGQGHSLNEIITVMQTVTGVEAQVRYLPGRGVDVPYSCLDIGRANVGLGWRPEIELLDGLAHTWTWVQSRGILTPEKATTSGDQS